MTELNYGGRLADRSERMRMLKALAAQHPQNHGVHKAFAILESVTNTADAVMSHLPLAFPRKKFLPIRGGYRLRRMKRLQAKTAVTIAPFIGAAQIAHIIAQPQPKYLSGGPLPYYIAADFNDTEKHRTVVGTRIGSLLLVHEKPASLQTEEIINQLQKIKINPIDDNAGNNPL